MENTYIWISIGVSCLVSIISNKILAAYTFKVIDGYVKDMIEMTKKTIGDIKNDWHI